MITIYDPKQLFICIIVSRLQRKYHNEYFSEERLKPSANLDKACVTELQKNGIPQQAF